MNEEKKDLREERKEHTEEHEELDHEDSGPTIGSILGAGTNAELRREREEKTPVLSGGSVDVNRRPFISPPAPAQRAAGLATGAAAAAAPALAHDDERGPLIAENEVNDLRSRWDAIQVGFVDEPRQAVEQADHLVAEAMKRIAEVFANERSRLEGQWDRGDNVSTEDLRVVLQRYRSFFGRLLSV
ncbi:MAG TPA: hypothetical protein VFO34_01625 [Candidatus Acidoferrales bacterium]|nr:hypothetical protein [Candidatus Acidoferrales bacterium]